MNPQPEAYIVHDGTIIKDANDAFCELFRCERQALIDRAATDIVESGELRELARLRAKHLLLVNVDYETIFKQAYSFLRFDGSRFFGVAISQRINETDYRTEVRWEYDE
jgi:PAS domain-containing protein